MALDPQKIETLIRNYSSLTRLAITLGMDAAKFIKGLFTQQPDLTVEQQDEILVAVLADGAVREALALKDAGLGTE